MRWALEPGTSLLTRLYVTLATVPKYTTHSSSFGLGHQEWHKDSNATIITPLIFVRLKFPCAYKGLVSALSILGNVLVQEELPHSALKLLLFRRQALHHHGLIKCFLVVFGHRSSRYAERGLLHLVLPLSHCVLLLPAQNCMCLNDVVGHGIVGCKVNRMITSG